MKATALCRTCRAPIWWGVTLKDRSMPFNPEPTEDGEWVIDGKTDNGAPRVRRHEPLTDPEDTKRYTPHWATCPDADEHRGGH